LNLPSIAENLEMIRPSAPSSKPDGEPLSLQTLAAIHSALAHEVRGPLRWVTSFSELLIQERGACLDEIGKDYLQRISGAAARLDWVMRDLQRFIARGIQEPRVISVSLEAAVCAVLGNFSCQISARNAQVTIQRPLPHVQGDPNWIEEILAQLLDNALKFTPGETAPSVRICAESSRCFVRLYVEDNGVGIPAAHQGRIFELFTRFNAASPGTGAGLALASQACMRMGGRIGVESDPGQGSRFWIELPKAE
jgi:signal transduction histidine kinase